MYCIIEMEHIKNINLCLAKREKMSKKGKKCFTNEERFYIIVLEFNAR